MDLYIYRLYSNRAMVSGFPNLYLLSHLQRVASDQSSV